MSFEFPVLFSCQDPDSPRQKAIRTYRLPGTRHSQTVPRSFRVNGSRSLGSMAADATTALNEVFILLGIGLAIILLRLYARWEAVGFSRWEADDYLMILVMVSIDCARSFGQWGNRHLTYVIQGAYSAESALAYQVVANYDGLANNGMTDQQRADLSPDSDEYRMRYVTRGVKSNCRRPVY